MLIMADGLPLLGDMSVMTGVAQSQKARECTSVSNSTGCGVLHPGIGSMIEGQLEFELAGWYPVKK